MTELYLITGFLGAGKTTLLKNIIPYFSGRRLSIIVNEFGKEGVDGEVLRKVEASVTEISGGAVFCSCRLDQFETVLKDTIKNGFEVILLEASGLADPGNIEKILAQDTFSGVDYKGSICMVDALNFKKVSSTVRVCKKQLAISRTVLVNKTDLATQEQLNETIDTIMSLSPQATIHTTSFGNIKPEWLKTTQKVGSTDPVYQTKDLGLQKKTIRFGKITRYQLQKFIEMIAEDTHRLKGIIRCVEGDVHVDCVGPVLVFKPYQASGQTHFGLTALAGADMPMEKAIQNAVNWYSPQIERVE